MGAANITRFQPDDLTQAPSAFQRDGVVIVEDVFKQHRLDEFRFSMEKQEPRFFGVGLPPDRKDLGEGRFIAPVELTPSFDVLDLLTDPTLVSVLESILDPTFVFEAFGIISALPGCSEQQIHFDGGLLFPRTGIDHLLPAPAVTLVIPLVRMDQETGTTEFWPGSHRGIEPTPEHPSAKPIIEVGSFALWDFRIRHRGLANLSGRVRPLLYVTACHPFWTDHKNFERGQNAKLLLSRQLFAAMGEACRQRFIRAEIVE